eukprot:sb/3468469/
MESNQTTHQLYRITYQCPIRSRCGKQLAHARSHGGEIRRYGIYRNYSCLTKIFYLRFTWSPKDVDIPQLFLLGEQYRQVKNNHLMPHKRQYVVLHGTREANGDQNPRKRIRPNALFVCGGIDSKRIFLKSVECYDVEKNEWYPCADMLTKRGSHGIALMNGKIYAVGGHDGNEFLDTVEMYDPVTDIWTNLPRMTRARNGAGAAVIGDKLYAIGSFDFNFLDVGVLSNNHSSPGGRDKQSRHKTFHVFIGPIETRWIYC